MSAICQSNPLKQLVGKTDQFRATGFRHHRPATTVAGPSSGQLASTVQHQFAQRETNSNPFMAGVTPQHLSNNMSSSTTASSGPVSGGPAAATAGDSWTRQFAAMQIEDRLGFSSEYMRLYEDYEKPQRNMRASFGSTIGAQRPMAALGNLHQQTVNYAEIDAEMELLEREFLETDLSTVDVVQNEDHTSFDAGAPDEEQTRFQMAAAEVRGCLESHQENPKFQQSQFLGLMRKISDGVVTLQKTDQSHENYTTLYSPTTGETIGSEYFPVQDAVQPRR
ncbi:LAMI_0G02058g1_1 [Lachancea mirantina]|uniref:LAMI_0G02058g1_1 n=1 Tax=Lachancea mirantina TaxID=1230905 RepID=A0A1G4K7M7_9SACH|nr:LAMI_0G02058g1_1 [Lachancea mirantina]